ncbi:hypothetical protein PSN45_004205 [Yamadazyma tenuis]|uniref:Dak1-domain-containing protein n=1 Tax=Candida tenuis (strain ATCC 10573 / BCRC 21748 / CBS 615 / JCM 9827 / NBRC 10315 / NRRL Y-1498 / VKM Y-70) TaxID=590646 RepID=G3B3T3_CANTC|nr:Dak1-domain-containing protein [Yamadazyma tenuis ATCC 10573]EGV63726.1 Dak1-domain-containing protein [Yamadazyma tenuis ATCC 10573]WEJ96663.1 hypothetical protein PSN45_004205 [Yamadazyma tenuis]
MTKHFVPENPNNLVKDCLQGYIVCNEHLSVLYHEKVIFNNKFDSSQVCLISGGGSGHEPGWAGLVGNGMLAACAQGEVFASPNFKNIQAAEKTVHSQKGCILVITNYTGDNLYFGMAQQELLARYGPGHVKLLRCTDDAAIPRSTNSLVGRRTLAGVGIVIKMMGAATQLPHLSLDDIYHFGETVNRNVISINAGLDHVHIPGHAPDSDYGKLQPNEIEIGLGIHNEPGFVKLSSIPTNEALISDMLQYMLSQDDPERSYLKYDSSDQFILLFNNLGGLPVIEEKALLFQTVTQLDRDYGIVPHRVLAGNFVTSLNASIFTITLFNVTKTAGMFTEQQLFDLFDQPTNATNWPNYVDHTASTGNYKDRIIKSFAHYDEFVPDTTNDVQIDPQTLYNILHTGSRNLIRMEPLITEWDTKMGDGDCGKMLEIAANGVLLGLDQGEGMATNGSILTCLNRILAILSNDMGGTLGAILYIFMKSFINNLTINLGSSQTDIRLIFATSLSSAIETLKGFTKAREGHRTVMDVLIPFVRVFGDTLDIYKAVDAAEAAAEGTRKLAPKLGRATYVGGLENKKDFVPDPGAYGVYEAIRGLRCL